MTRPDARVAAAMSVSTPLVRDDTPEREAEIRSALVEAAGRASHQLAEGGERSRNSSAGK